jgi:hypothetical protein
MNPLDEIEDAAEKLPPAQLKEMVRFLTVRLARQEQTPPRRYHPRTDSGGVPPGIDPRKLGQLPEDLGAFIRLGTNPRVMAQPLTLDDALAYVDEWLDLSSIRFNGATDRHRGECARMPRGAQAIGNLVIGQVVGTGADLLRPDRPGRFLLSGSGLFRFAHDAGKVAKGS